MKAFIRISIFIFCLICAVAFFQALYHSPSSYSPSIKPIHSLAQALGALKECTDTTLITFDVDDTLTTAHDPLFQNQADHYPWLFRLQVAFRYPQLLNRGQWEEAISVAYLESKYTLIEPAITKIIRVLQDQGCKLIALTSMETGPFGVIPSFEKWRANVLQELGIDFDRSFNKDFVLDRLPNRNRYAVFYKGILCANQEDKGRVLLAFIERIDTKPTTIISFDDNTKALASIEKVCKLLGINFKGYLYLEGKEVLEPWDSQKALQRLDQIMQIHY